MSEQFPLSFLPGDRPPLARRTDPDSSHASADRVEKSGDLASQCALVLELVRRHEGRSSRELALLGKVDRTMVGRRAATLADAGRIYRTKEPGDEVRLWSSKSKAPYGAREYVKP